MGMQTKRWLVIGVIGAMTFAGGVTVSADPGMIGRQTQVQQPAGRDDIMQDMVVEVSDINAQNIIIPSDNGTPSDNTTPSDDGTPSG